MPQSYNQILQARTAIPSANTWTTVEIPIGARFPLLSVEDETVSFRVSTDNSLATDEGIYIPASGAYQHEGVNTDTLTLYVSASGTTTAIITYTKD
jgi:hypothetical protein